VHGSGAQLTEGLHLPSKRRIDFRVDEARGIRAVATLQAQLLRALRDRGREDRVSRAVPRSVCICVSARSMRKSGGVTLSPASCRTRSVS